MKLFLISQDENNEYDTYDSAVVIAEDAHTARNMHPRTGALMTPDDWGNPYGPWCSSPDDVSVVYLGEADENISAERAVICASFNAG